VEWIPNRVRYFVDDVLVKDCEFHWIHNDGRDGGPAHVLACLAVGGHWPGPPQADSFPASMAIEYIRVWQRDGLEAPR
jgi:beta-glucanase (GH16 family)